MSYLENILNSQLRIKKIPSQMFCPSFVDLCLWQQCWHCDVKDIMT